MQEQAVSTSNLSSPNDPSWKEQYDRDFGGDIRPEPASWKELYKMRQNCNLRISIMLTKLNRNLISAGFDKVISYSTSTGNDNHYAFINRRGHCYAGVIRNDKVIDFIEITYFRVKNIAIDKVACGHGFMLVLTKDGQVYLVNDFNNQEGSVILLPHRGVKYVFASYRIGLIFDSGEAYITGSNIIDRSGISFPPDPAPFSRILFEGQMAYLFNETGAVWQYNMLNGMRGSLPSDIIEYEIGQENSFFFRKEPLQGPDGTFAGYVKRLYSTIYDATNGFRNEQVYLSEVPDSARFLSVGRNHVAFMVGESVKVYPFQSSGFLTTGQEYLPEAPKNTTMEFLDIASGKNFLLVYTKYAFRTNYLEGIPFIRPILNQDNTLAMCPVGVNHKVYYLNQLMDHYVEILRDENDNVLPPIEDVSYQEMMDVKKEGIITHTVWYPGHQRNLYAPNRRYTYYLNDGTTFTCEIIPKESGILKADSMFR